MAAKKKLEIVLSAPDSRPHLVSVGQARRASRYFLRVISDYTFIVSLWSLWFT